MARPVAQVTLKQARQALGVLLSQTSPWAVITGTASGGGASTLSADRLYALPADSSQLAGKLIALVGGTGTGQLRLISGFTAPTITVSQAWATPPDSTSEFEIYTRWGKEALDQAIRQAVIDASEDSLQEAVDTSLTAVKGTQEYALPATLLWLHTVLVDSVELGRAYWSVRRGTAPKLVISPDVSLTTGDALELHGLQAPAVPAADSDILQVNPAYVVYTAASLIFEGQIRAPGADPEAHRDQAQMWAQRAAPHRPRFFYTTSAERVR